MANVTKTSLMNLLHTVPAGKDLTLEQWQDQVIGRALVAIFKRQTRDEQSSNVTNQHNNIGFAGCDAKTGSITAKYFIKHGKLLDFQRDCWMEIKSNGFPRIAKYDRQLNEIAGERAPRPARQPRSQNMSRSQAIASGAVTYTGD